MSPGDLDVDLEVSWPGADLAALDAGTAGLQTGPRDLARAPALDGAECVVALPLGAGGRRWVHRRTC